MTLKVLIFGASGFMMAHLVPHLKKNYDLELYAYVRPGSKGIPFLGFNGVKVIEGAWDDAELIRTTVAGFDIVWDAGDSHDPALPTLLVPILIGTKTTFVRFTGTGNWITQTGGNADASARLYDDAKAEDIAAIHGEMFNGAGDVIAIEGIKKGLNAWLLCTGGVYGPRPAGISSAGVFVRLYTNNALQLGYAPYIGEGTSHMQLIHVDDVITATDIFLRQLLPTVGKPVDPNIAPHMRFFNAPGYDVEWKDIASTWSAAFADSKRSIPVKQVASNDAGFIWPLINADMKSKGSHLGELGWVPRGATIQATLSEVLRGVEVPLP